MKKKIFWSVCAAAMMSVFAVRAQNTECCQKIPTCAEMGYNLSAPKGDGWFCTACPTDPKKFSCSEKPCPRGSISKPTCRFAHNNLSVPACFGGLSGDKSCYYCGKTIITGYYPGDSSRYTVGYTCY